LFTFVDGKYEEALSNYESAIHWLAPDDGWKAQVMVAVAALKYLRNEKKEAQAMLLEWYVHYVDVNITVPRYKTK